MPAIALILPAEGYRIDDFVMAATRLGLDVVIATDAHHSLAEEMGGAIVPVDFSDESDAARRLAGSTARYDAIVPIDDRGVRVAAGAAEMRGLVHNPAEAALAARDKGVARRMVGSAAPQPAHVLVEDGDDVAGHVVSLGGSVVIKPVGLAGSLGVIRVDDPDDAAPAADRARTIQAAHGYRFDHPLLMEAFVAGPEVSVEGLLTDGAWRTLAVFDKPETSSGPYFPETHFVTPSRTVDAATLERHAEAACEAMGLRQGPVHAEFRLSPAPVLIELAARTIGGLCGRALRFGLADTSLEELVLRNALGDDVRGTRLAPGASGVSMIGVDRPGVFMDLGGVEAALELEAVTGIEVSHRRRQWVNPLPDESTYLGFVFARADDPAIVESGLRSAVGRLDVRIDDSAPAPEAGS